jgi:hypothetical protein
VALKVPKFGPDEPGQVERFLEEGRAAARLRHPNIVAVFESGRAGDDYYIASEFVEGMPLSARLRTEPPDFRQAAQWVRDLAAGLACAHAAGVIHRDIKPANILLDRAGRPQLADFGLAKRVGEDATRTTDGTVLGTPAYMAPEQARGQVAAVGPHSDQYSLGVVLYELLTRRRPFEGTPHAVLAQVVNEEPRLLSQVNPAVPRELEAVCLKAMAREPRRRYAGVTDLAADLDRFLAGEPVHARRPGMGERTRRWLWRRRQPLLLVAGVAAAVFVTLGIIWLNGGFRSPPSPELPLQTEESPVDPGIEVQARLEKSAQNLHSLGMALHNSCGVYSYFPQPALYGKDGTPLLSWRVALLPFLDQTTLYKRFHLDEPWDSPHNLELVQHMPKVYENPGVSTSKPYMTSYQIIVGPGAVFEANPKQRIGLADITDERASTLLVVEAAEPVEWTRPTDLTFAPDRPLPGFGAEASDGFPVCFSDGRVSFLKAEINKDDKLLRALITRSGGELVNLRPYAFDPRQTRPKASPTKKTQSRAKGEQANLVVTQEAEMMKASRMKLWQLALALKSYQDRNGTLPPPAIYDKKGTPLLSWRVAILPDLDKKALYNRFRLDEPWDSPANRALLEYMPDVFGIPDVPLKDPNSTYYQVFVGPGAFEEGTKQRTTSDSIPDGLSKTIAVVEGGDPVLWTAPVDLPFGPNLPLPKLGGPFASGFNAAMFDGSAMFFRKGLYADEKALRALIGWNDGEVVNLRPYLEPALPRSSPDGAAGLDRAQRFASERSLMELGLALKKYHSTYGHLPSYAICTMDGRPLLSWRVALLPFLDEALLYKKFKLDEPWDNPHNRALLPLMPWLFDMAATDGDSEKTYYQAFVGRGAAFERDPSKQIRLTDITDGTANTLLLAEAGVAVPWTKPEDLFIEADKPLPRLGGLFPDGFYACTADSRIHFLSRKIYRDEPALRALIGIRNGQPVDLKDFR